MFIVIDWIDWSGKWTQVKILEKKLKDMWKKVKILDYPRYEETSSFMVQKYLNWNYGSEVWPKLSSIFYAIDRFDSSFDLKKDFETFDYIISNRYVSASIIHQSWKIENQKERNDFIIWLEDLEYNIFGIPKPDLTIFLNVSPETSQCLVLNKEKRDYIKWWKKMDIHEEDKNHLINAHRVAIEIVKSKNDWLQINCEKECKMRDIEEINNDILNLILKK